MVHMLGNSITTLNPDTYTYLEDNNNSSWSVIYKCMQEYKYTWKRFSYLM